jgi:hypothetical protein
MPVADWSRRQSGPSSRGALSGSSPAVLVSTGASAALLLAVIAAVLSLFPALLPALLTLLPMLLAFLPSILAFVVAFLLVVVAVTAAAFASGSVSTPALTTPAGLVGSISPTHACLLVLSTALHDGVSCTRFGDRRNPTTTRPCGVSRART